MQFKNVLAALGVATAMGAASAAHADVVLWIDDVNNNIGTVDLTNHSASKFIGNAGTDGVLTDIGFTSNGTLYGVNFDNTYVINTTTGHATFLASNPNNSNLNALVGVGSNGLYGAANDTHTLYSFNTTTKNWSTLSGSTGGDSSGDLAPGNGVYYESESDGNADALFKLTVSGNSVSSTKIGDFNINGFTFGLGSVFGLADDGTTLYAVDGTTIYSVNTSNAALTELYDYSGKICSGSGRNQTCLGDANGTAFLNEATGGVPEPATWGLMIVGAGLIGSQLRRRQSVAGAVA